MFGDWQLSRGIGRVYVIWTGDKPGKWELRVGTGFVLKVAGRKVIVTSLALLRGDTSSKEGRKLVEGGVSVLVKRREVRRPLCLVGFGNMDLERHVREYMRTAPKKDAEQGGGYNHDAIVAELTAKFAPVLVPTSLNDTALGARADWL